MMRSYTRTLHARVAAAVWLVSAVTVNSALVAPTGFVFLHDIDPQIQQSVRYATRENFMGRVVPGYTHPTIVATSEACEALKRVQADVKQQGYELVVYDGYRPQRSVDAFIAWSQNVTDQIAKQDYYPTIPKENVFDLGYLVKRSSHSRGSTIDLSLIPLGNKVQPIARRDVIVGDETLTYLDDGTVWMGTSFDTFHEASHHDSPLVDATAAQYRDILRSAMGKQGFQPYAYEWWHYTLKNEPYPDTYFDAVILDTADESGGEDL